MELKDLVQEVLGEIAKNENSDEKRQEQEAKVKEIQSIFTEDENLNRVIDAAEKAIEKEKNIQNQEAFLEPEVDSAFEHIQHKGEIESATPKENFVHEEELFLSGLRERLLVIFEGFQSPNNQSIEAKLDLTLNFLEYLLARIEERLEEIDSKK